MLNSAFGLRITFSLAALENTEERLFPDSRHRSRRIHKKLVKRFGGEFRKVPCMWKTPAGIIAHPSLKTKIEAAIASREADQC